MSSSAASSDAVSFRLKASRDFPAPAFGIHDAAQTILHLFT